jgi:ABC-2 type transport system permease protein
VYRRSLAIIAHDLRVLKRDPAFIVIMIVMPLIMMVFLKGTFRLSLRASGYPNATGAEQIVPGGIVMFSTFMMGNLAFAVFREHGYGTWDRLRASPASTLELLLGKSVVPLLTLALQSVVLFVFGLTVFGLRIPGSWPALLLVAVSHWLCLTAVGLFLLTICRTIQQVNAASNVGAMVLSGLGGAFTPLSGLPTWARHIAPATPHYWAMRGFRSVILGSGGFGTALLPSGVLLGVAVALTIFTRFRFNADDKKLSWA